MNEAPTADHGSGTLPRVTAVVEHDAAVDDDRVDADRVLKWIGEGRAVSDRCRIEDHQIGGETRCDHAAIGEMQLRRGQAAHLVDRLLERDDVLLSDVLAEYPRERAEVAWMRHPRSNRRPRGERRPLGSTRHPRLPHPNAQIAFVRDYPEP